MSGSPKRRNKWMPTSVSVPKILTIVEECSCSCGQADAVESSRCHLTCSGSTAAAGTDLNDLGSDTVTLEDFDGVDDILAVSQVSERASCSSAAGGSGPGGVPPSAPGRRKPAPLLRARTLPAIVTPSLCIIQAQLDAGQQQGTAMTQHRQPRHAKKKQQADSCKGSPDKADASPPSARLLARRSPSGGTLRTRSTQDTSARKWHIIQEKNK
ncbi:uncharacterized protein LOC121838539 [Ixodes scapularis]|uniref:uncharacterized protein LOC121838539 n=1 Tax=Ixodes scapularis TaxID=6945 RepID=UPI001C382469|nr:uncharacterized protein LOC121838539 [Ixodes scapularis]